MKIIFTNTVLGAAGAPKMIMWVAEQMSKKGNEVILLDFFPGNKRIIPGENVKYDCLNLWRSKSRIGRNTIGMIRALHAIDKYVKKEKPDVFVSFLDSVGYMYLPVARKRCKVVISERVDPNLYGGIVSKIRFYLMKYADKTVFQTEGARRFFKDKYREIYDNSTVISNPAIIKEDVRELKDCIPAYDDRDNRIVTVGRLSVKQKRQDVMIKAFDIVHKKHPELEMVIYGWGADKEKIQAFIDEMGLTDNITLWGKTTEAEKAILNARAFVLTSDYEGMPNALIEALSVGVPCVSTDCSPGGAAVLIKDGENGFLVPKGDVKAVAEGLLKIIESKEISDRFTKNGPKICDEFSEDKTAHMWENVFEELCGGKAK